MMVNSVKKFLLCFVILVTFSLSSILYATIKRDEDIKKVNIEEQVLTSNSESVYVYFPRLPDMKFVGEKLEFDRNLPREEKIKVVLKKLSEGPQDEELISVMPHDTVLNKVRVKNNIAYVDFSREFIENHPGGSMGEYNTLYSIVNSLTEIEGINAVDFSIQGEKLETYKGHCEFSEPLYRE